MENIHVTTEREHTILGVEGRLFPVIRWPAEVSTKLGRMLGFMHQTWGATRVKGKYQTSVEIRFDDNCKNGHNTFSITGVVRDTSLKARNGDNITVCGCIHEEISKVFPELIPLLKWHGTTSDEPLCYIENTVYLAGNRDYHGLLKGERRQLRSGGDGPLAWRLAKVDSQGDEMPDGALPRYIDSDTPPTFPSVRLMYLPWERIGEGKERQLQAARDAAVWPEATDAELMLPPELLTEVLVERLPALMQAFKNDMVAVCGFLWDT